MALRFQFITLMAFFGTLRDATAQQVIARLRPQLAEIEGIKVLFQAAQDINVGGRLAKTRYQYTLLLIGIVRKNGIMMVDFAISATLSGKRA